MIQFQDIRYVRLGTRDLAAADCPTSRLKNIQTILRSAGAEMTDVVEVSSFLVNIHDFAGYNAVYAEWFGGMANPPARTTAILRVPPVPTAPLCS